MSMFVEILFLVALGTAISVGIAILDTLLSVAFQ